jgi:Zn-dependent peptidase ImmA (M78 family)
MEIAVANIPKNPVHSLLTRLDSAGVSAGFARKVLPTWWDDEIAQSKSGLQQAQMYFARAFHIDLSSLAQSHGPVLFQETQRKFKLSRNVVESEVSVSAHFATAMANVALAGFRALQLIVPKDPVELRAAILEKHKFVNLSALLTWCAEANIPVLHIHRLPGKKMTGLVVREDGRFAIVLSKKGTPSHLLFHLAHELGHIANEHLQGNGFVADEKIGGSDTGDADEKEADAYAIRLLNGREVSYGPATASVIRSGAALYQAAVAKANQERIDVGHIILNYGNSQQTHALATMALKSIPGESDGIKVVNTVFFKTLDAGKLSDDQLELLKTATGYSA